jgi:hypothetical protein
MRYCLVTPEGDITFDVKTLHEIRVLVGGNGVGETGLEFLNSLYPVAAYYYVPFDVDDRRMNKAANGMFWELNGPVPNDDDPDREPFDPDDRVIKLRGPVAFIDRHSWGLSGSQEASLRTAHETAVGRLRRRGWL